MKTESLSIDLLRIDGETQNRANINEDAVEDYCVLIQEADVWPFPPIDVFHDGSEYFVADGFHRTLGASRAKRASVPCNVHNGTARDARIFGMTANDHNGLRMTRADKRRCVEWLLANGGKMTQKEIARLAGVTSRTVKMIVAEQNPVSIAGKAKPSKGDGKGKTSPTVQPDDETPEVAAEPEPEDLDFVEPTDAEIQSATAEPPSSAKKANSKPAVSDPDCKALFKEYDRAIGPLVRLVDRIAGQVNGKNGEHHRTVQEHLNYATEEMMEWMGVETK